MHTILSPSVSSFAPNQFVNTQATAVSQPALQLPQEVAEVIQPPVCGVLTIIPDTKFSPTGIRSVPDVLIIGVTLEVSISFAVAYNQSKPAITKGRWALVSTTGKVVILCGVDASTRPTDPTAYPECVVTGLTHDQAVEMSDKQNRPRLEHARVPRFWSIPVRPLNGMVIGGGTW